METFFTFAFGQLKSSQEFLNLFSSLENGSDMEKIQLSIVQVIGLEPSNFDTLAYSLMEFKSKNPEFVYKTNDLLICECITDLKVHFNNDMK